MPKTNIARAIAVEVMEPQIGPCHLLVKEAELILAAIEVRKNAQAPYSHYFVGAAVLSESGRIYHGCNLESVAQSPTIHAEGSAVTRMVADEGPGTKIKMIAVVGAPEGVEIKWGVLKPRPRNLKIEDFCFACGHCLGTIWENCLGDRGTPMLLFTKWGEVARTTIGDAYPMSFGPENLGVDVRRKVE